MCPSAPLDNYSLSIARPFARRLGARRFGTVGDQLSAPDDFFHAVEIKNEERHWVGKREKALWGQKRRGELRRGKVKGEEERGPSILVRLYACLSHAVAKSVLKIL